MLKIPWCGPKGYVLRNYSLSRSPTIPAITVSRSSGGRPRGPGLPVDLSSNYLHDNVGVGAVLAVDGPRGEFVLDL